MEKIKLTKFNYPSVHVMQHELKNDMGDPISIITAVSNVDKDNGERKQVRKDITVDKEVLTHQHFIDLINDVNIECYEFITGKLFTEEEKEERNKSNIYSVKDIK